MGVGGEVAPDTNKIFMEETNMKKIVAVVLAMVMALALCTTAFAATTKTEVDSKDYTLKAYQTNADQIITSEKISIVKRDAEKTTVGSETTTKYFADTYTLAFKASENEAAAEDVLYACDASIAVYKLVKGGAVVAYLTTDEVNGENGNTGIEKIVDKYVAEKDDDDKTCGDYNDDVYMIGGKAYLANTGSNYAMLNGKAVVYGGEATDKVPHKWLEKNITFDTKGVPVSITCDSCKKTFKVVASDKIPSDYAGDTATTSLEKLANYVVLLGTTTTSTGSTTTTSPKTFDAGIAMYVGMALTSVAGSAVVIGKKKEF